MKPSAQSAIDSTPDSAAANAPLLPPVILTRRVPPWAGALLIAALWLISRPYRGVRHDGILYLGQTLARLMPESIGRDLYMVHGSQDSYSVFSMAMAPLVAHLGVGLSQVLVLYACQALFLVACWMLTRELGASLLRWGAMLALVAVAHSYGGSGNFAFAEPFLTARVMAEPVVLFSLVLLLRGRLPAAALLMLMAIAIHPLIALPALATGWVFLCLDDRRWLWCLVIVAFAALAGGLGLRPFDALWRSFDPQWWALVHQANWITFFANAGVLDWAPIVLDAGILLAAAGVLASEPLRRFVRALLLVAAALTVAWGLGQDVLHDVLLTQLQLWRVFWLVHLLALLLLPLLLANFWARGPIGRWCAAAFVLAVVAVNGNLATGWVCVVLAGLAWLSVRAGARVSPGIARLAASASLLAALGVTAIVGYRTHEVVATQIDRFDGAGDLQVLVGLTLVSAVLGSLVLRGLASSVRWRAAAVVATLALGAAGLSCWDQRSDWQRFVEDGLQERGLPFEGMIPPQATVYWDGSLLEGWMLTGRPQFYEMEQSSGLLFSRATAMAFQANREILSPLLVQQEVCPRVAQVTGADLSDPDTCAPPPEILRAVCQAPGHPDYMVLRSGIKGTPGSIATWTYRPNDPLRVRRYRVYACSAQQH